jgi:glycosyltransferase involved in cell wall biosynthesis
MNRRDVERHLISVIVTAHNEGAELHRTLASVAANTTSLREIIVVDDGSSDGSCAAIENSQVQVIRNETRIGVAHSRDVGSRAACGTVLCYLDAHQRVSKHCLDRCAELAQTRRAVVCPDVRNYGRLKSRLHGADFSLCAKAGYFSARWREGIVFALRNVSPVTGLRAPPYLIPRELYGNVAWSPLLRGWGGSEASMVVKSFFMGIPILNLTRVLAHHRFQKSFPYETTWEGVWRNQAIIARICFDDHTWYRHWLPRVFQGHLTDDARTTLESAEVQLEHSEFLRRKVRTDRQFWIELLRQRPPDAV